VHQILAFGKDDVWFLTDSSVGHWDGINLLPVGPPDGIDSLPIGPPDKAIGAMGGTSSKDLVIISGGSMIHQWNGTYWEQTISPVPGALLAVQADKHNQLWAVGTGGVALRRNPDKLTWQPVVTGATTDLRFLQSGERLWALGSTPSQLLSRE
jgi:hypothetical protein